MLLAHVEAKRGQAKEHATKLKAEIDRWEQAHRDSVPVRGDYEPDSQRIEFRVTRVPEMPDLRWGAVLGDVLTNLRSGLDYLAWFAAIVSSDGQPSSPNAVKFPIMGSSRSFSKSRAVAQFESAYKTFFEQFQPYLSWPGPAWWTEHYEHPLLLLQRLSNNDKHRLVTPMLFQQGVVKLPPGLSSAVAAAGHSNEQIASGALVFSVPAQLISSGAVDALVSPFVGIGNGESVHFVVDRLLEATDVVFDAAKGSELFTRRTISIDANTG